MSGGFQEGQWPSWRRFPPTPRLRKTILLEGFPLDYALTNLLYCSGYGQTVTIYDFYSSVACAPI